MWGHMQVSYKLKRIETNYNVQNVRAVYYIDNKIKIYYNDKKGAARSYSLDFSDLEYIFIDRTKTENFKRVDEK